MRILTNLFIICFITIALSACAGCGGTSGKFTADNLMKVHQGMSSDEILKLFGKPTGVDMAVCGGTNNRWTCTTWEYYDFILDTKTSFTFSGEHNALKLNNFSTH